MQQHEIDNQGAINLVGAVYRETCKRLITAYRRNDAYEIRQAERWIRDNNYGLVSDPDGIIRACRKAAEEKGMLKAKYKHSKK